MNRSSCERPARGRPTIDAKERFRLRVEIDATTGCHNWTGCIVHGGYGQFSTGGKGKKARAHRVAYEWVKGPIPDGLVIDHLCRNPRCVNPDHLEAVTMRENTLRGVGPPALCATKSHCKHGHLFNEENTGRRNGHRYCKACKVEYGATSTHRYRRADISEEQIHLIKTDGRKAIAWARELGVAASTITRIRNGRKSQSAIHSDEPLPTPPDNP